MKLKLLGFDGDPIEFDIGDLNDIATITINVVTGDEIAFVVYKDYTVKTFDAGIKRRADFNDGRYEIYRYDSKENLIDDPKFKERRSSYWWWYSDDEDES